MQRQYRGAAAREAERRDGMRRVADVRVRVLRSELDEPVRMSFGALAHRWTALVEVEADDGTVGHGESWINYPPWACFERVATIRRGIAPALVGEPVDDHRRVVAELRAGLVGFARQWGAPGPVAQALSGVDIALWDLVGKLRDASVAELLGGRERERAPVYASGLGPDGVAELVARVLKKGFTRAKCRVGFGEATDIATVDSARTLLTDEQLVLDANQAWTLEEAVRRLSRLASPATPWVEEPLRDMDPAELTALFRRTGIPAAAGENTYGRRGFAALAAHEAIAVLQPDVAKLGGVGELLAVCELAADHGKPVAPHWYGGGVALAAAAQVAAAHPAITGIEYDVRDNPFRDELVVGGFAVEHGEIAVPDGPGLGVEIDQDAVRRYEFADTAAPTAGAR